ncbi:hypothetical protein D3C79_1050850 [compost metagenome]
MQHTRKDGSSAKAYKNKPEEGKYRRQRQGQQQRPQQGDEDAGADQLAVIKTEGNKTGDQPP